MRSRLIALAAAGLAALAVVPAHADGDKGKGKGHGYGHEQPHHPTPSDPCSGDPREYARLDYVSGGQPAKALYVLPKGKPRGIVVFDHGYGHTMYSWIQHMERTASTLGVIAVTPDYRGQVDSFATQPLPSSRGWQVSEGAVDTNTVAQLFDKLCLKGKGHNVLYGVSMGGNTSGLALAAQPKRQGGAPLWDEWIDVEGAVNVLETYQGARALAPVNAYAANAKADIEREMGGTFEQKPGNYRKLSVVTRTSEIAASGIKGVVMVHAYADGLVTHDIARQLQALLRAQNVPVDFRSFLTHSATSESGTTLDGYVPTNRPSPFAGHASEVSDTQDVGKAGFAALAELYRGQHVMCRDSVTDGVTGEAYTAFDGCA